MRGLPIARRPNLRELQGASTAATAIASTPGATLGSRVGECLVTSTDYPAGSASTVKFMTVPAGVHRISVLGITAGTHFFTDGTNKYYGFPGAVGYANNVPVTPGEVLTIEVWSAPSYNGQSFCIVRNSAGNVIFGIGRTDTRYDGTLHFIGRSPVQARPPVGYINTPYYSTGNIGSGGGYSTGGLSPYGIGPDGIASYNGHGSQQYPDWPAFGAFISIDQTRSVAAAGCVRIIWGPGRSYPFNARPMSKSVLT